MDSSLGGHRGQYRDAYVVDHLRESFGWHGSAGQSFDFPSALEMRNKSKSPHVVVTLSKGGLSLT
jgi:hypothetical protein